MVFTLLREYGTHTISRCISLKEALDEVSVVASESEEFADFCRVPGYRPVCHALEFLGIHLYSAIPNDDTKVINFFLFEIAFFGFQV